MRVAVLVAPLYVPVIVTAVAVATALLVMAKVAVVAPAATVTEAGVVAALMLLLASVTSRPARWSCRGESDGTCAGCAARNSSRIQRERGETGRRIDGESGCLGRTVVCAGDCHSRRCCYGLAGDGEGGRRGACGHGDRCWRCGGIDVVARECDHGPARWGCGGESHGTCAGCAAHNGSRVQRERGEPGRRIDGESGCLGAHRCKCR